MLSKNGKISFFFMAESYSILFIHHIFFIYSSIDEHLGCFHILAIVNNAGMNTGMYISFKSVFLFSLEKIPRSGIAGLYDSSVFNFFRNFYTVFHSSSTNL